jgi:hypothetical protein
MREIQGSQTFRKRDAVIAGALLLLALLVSCTDHTSASRCTKDSDCKDDRLCRDGECSDPGTPTATNGAPASSAGGSKDPCTEAGGTKLPGGGCHKTCTYEEKSPGGDLHGDCDDLGWVCTPVYTTEALPYCREKSCLADADCGTGWKCVSMHGSLKFCALACSTDAECPSSGFACITSCPNGYYSPAGFCAAKGVGSTENANDPASSCKQ